MVINYSVYICHSIITLYKSISFSVLHNESDSSIFICTSYSTKFDDHLIGQIQKDFNVILCPYTGFRNGKLRLISWRRYLNRLIRIINGHSSNKANTLYVFLDQDMYMPTLIEWFKKKENNKVILLEEGLGLYSLPSDNKTVGRSNNIKKYLCHLLGINPYCFYNSIIGMNKNIDAVYCSSPGDFQRTNKLNDIPICYEGNIFNRSNLNSFFSYFSVEPEDLGIIESADFIFLTQPILEYISEEEYETLIIDILNILKKYGNIVIKKHPRDNYNYQNILDDQVFVCDDAINQIPFELISQYASSARMITFSTSCCNNIASKKKSIFLYNLVPSDKFIEISKGIIFSNNNIEVAGSLYEFEQMLLSE